MTHKIKVQMFGNFRMDYNGAPFVAEKMHKESQFNRMMQALIHYSDCGIAKDKLEEIVIGERDIDAPHTALRVIVYKTKQKLAQLGLPGKNLIYLEGGIYYWTPDIEIEEDAAEFEKLYNEACALEKQMPQEPESAETVCDERIKEIEDNMLELYVKALYLYKGEFLAAYTGETWIAQEARRYHTMFEKIINEAAYILRKRKQFKGLEKIGVYAAKVDPFNEWEELIMEAMVETRRYDEAEELYTDVVDYYLRECGIYPSSRLLEILEKYSNQMNHAHEILENIQEGMNEQEETERGGYFCSYPVFKGIYQASIRIMKRTRVPVYLMLCTLEDEEDRQVQSETKINKYSRQLKKCVGESIRYSDIYLNALTGKSCMLVTTNEYLASRDGAEMGEVYNFMGLSCSYPDADDTKKQDDDEKRQFYSADIIYTTNGALGFDFLFDNLVKKKDDRFLCDFHYVIIDEADSVLLDSAIMPLVISGVPRVQSNLYDVCDFFVTTLVEDIDYIEEDKAVWLTPKGVKFAESFFGISNFYGKENFEINYNNL